MAGLQDQLIDVAMLTQPTGTVGMTGALLGPFGEPCSQSVSTSLAP
jgi:hypothetical protein